MIRCPDGHFYDAGKHTTCPWCAPPIDLGVASGPTDLDLGKTKPMRAVDAPPAVAPVPVPSVPPDLPPPPSPAVKAAPAPAIKAAPPPPLPQVGTHRFGTFAGIDP